MGYMLEAFIGKEDVLKLMVQRNSAMRIVPLKQALFMIPIGYTLKKLLGADLQFSADHPFYALSSPIKNDAIAVSTAGKIAYVEAEYFGGIGHQSAILWENGTPILGPLFAQNLPLREMSINRVLKEMGVIAHDQLDEFDALGLGKYRDTDKWLTD